MMKQQKNPIITELNTKNEEYIKQVLEILNENFQYPWNKNHLGLNNKFQKNLVAIYNKKIIGFISGEIFPPEANILMLAVKKTYQDKGVGKKLLQYFIKEISNQYINQIWLEVSKQNKKALNFYLKNNFKKEYIRKKYYKDGSDAIIMRFQIST